MIATETTCVSCGHGIDWHDQTDRFVGACEVENCDCEGFIDDEDDGDEMC